MREVHTPLSAKIRVPARCDPSLRPFFCPASRGNQQRKPRRDFLHAVECADRDFRGDRPHNRDESGEQRGEDEQNLAAPAADREPGRPAARPRAASGACAGGGFASLNRIALHPCSWRGGSTNCRSLAPSYRFTGRHVDTGTSYPECRTPAAVLRYDTRAHGNALTFLTNIFSANIVGALIHVARAVLGLG